MENQKAKNSETLVAVHTHAGSFRKRKKERGITLIALVITIVLNCCFTAMEQMLNKVNILKI